ncbi:hypothetical protein SO802_005982 [Lithocarpus litseifolius]|uniref:Uncharacterized protein n=1 Tax=Lithocarpus litseifolius TaxID=425828 RepID=A0AAW2DL31_9ROSI
MAVPYIAQSNDALLIKVDPGTTPMCTFIPREFNRDQMTSLFPESWIMKYEMLHQATKSIKSNDPFFITKENGKVETRFLTAPPEKKDMVFKSRNFEKVESLAMKANHLLVTYGGIFVIVLIAKRKKFLKKIIQEERKNLPSKYSKKDMKQEIQKLTSLENPLENLIIMPQLPIHRISLHFKVLNIPKPTQNIFGKSKILLEPILMEPRDRSLRQKQL